jgi:hypothetical protein
MPTVVVFGARDSSAGDSCTTSPLGTIVRVAVRHPDAPPSALPAADLTQVMFVRADVRDRASVAGLFARRKEGLTG